MFALNEQPIDVILTIHANNLGVKHFVDDYYHAVRYPHTSRLTHLILHNLIHTYGSVNIENFILNTLKMAG